MTRMNGWHSAGFNQLPKPNEDDDVCPCGVTTFDFCKLWPWKEAPSPNCLRNNDGTYRSDK